MASKNSTAGSQKAKQGKQTKEMLSKNKNSQSKPIAGKKSPESEKIKPNKESEAMASKTNDLESAQDKEVEKNPPKKRTLKSTAESEKNTKDEEIKENPPKRRAVKSTTELEKTKIQENSTKKGAIAKSKNEKTKPDIEDKENPPQRRSTRSTRSTRSMAEIGGQADEDGNNYSPEKLVVTKKLTFVNYTGAIKYHTETHEIAEISDNLLQWVEKQPGEGLIPIAFDMEWPFSFKTGPGKSAVIQICAELTTCYIFQLTNVKKLPAALVCLLKHKRVRLHGVNVKNDFRKLGRDYPEVNSDDLIVNGLDLGVWCNQVCETGGRWSLDRLAGYTIGKAVDKNKKVRMSKWHVIPLDETQLLYAALDVYIGQLMYNELEKRLKIKEENESSFIEKNGEAAFKAIKALGENFTNAKVTEDAA